MKSKIVAPGIAGTMLLLLFGGIVLGCAKPADAAVWCPAGQSSPGPCRAYANQQVSASNIDGASAESVNLDDMIWDNIGDSLILKSVWYVFPGGQQWIELGTRLGFLADGRVCDPACAYWEISDPNGVARTDIIGPNPISGTGFFEISRNADGTFSLWLDQPSASYSRTITSFQNTSFTTAGWVNFGMETSSSSNSFTSGTYHDYVTYRTGGAWLNPTGPEMLNVDSNNPDWHASSSFSYDPVAQISTATYTWNL
jgi:hypothetical protein